MIAFDKGYEAWTSGTLLAENPHKYQSRLWWQWKRGWCKAAGVAY